MQKSKSIWWKLIKIIDWSGPVWSKDVLFLFIRQLYIQPSIPLRFSIVFQKIYNFANSFLWKIVGVFIIPLDYNKNNNNLQISSIKKLNKHLLVVLFFIWTVYVYINISSLSFYKNLFKHTTNKQKKFA